MGPNWKIRAHYISIRNTENAFEMPRFFFLKGQKKYFKGLQNVANSCNIDVLSIMLCHDMGSLIITLLFCDLVIKGCSSILQDLPKVLNNEFDQNVVTDLVKAFDTVDCSVMKKLHRSEMNA